MRRWAAGSSEVPAGLYVDHMRVATERAAVLDALALRLREMGGAQG
jgi:hypothetical protein